MLTRVIWARVEADRLVARRGVGFYGGELEAASGGTATVVIRDGLGASAVAIYSFSAAASALDRQALPFGILIREGLFVDLGSNVSRFILYYDPTGQE